MAQSYWQKARQTAWYNIYAIFTVNNCDFFQILTKCHLKKYALYAKECTKKAFIQNGNQNQTAIKRRTACKSAAR